MLSRNNMIISLLLASAAIMAGVLAFSSDPRTSYGQTQVANTDFVLMTARAVENGDDSVLVLEKSTGKLLTYQYRSDPSGSGRLLLASPVDLSKINKPK
jgi:hypothetical protein